jgi:hypothetical protein
MSGWPDLNRRPPGPKPGALPSCATARCPARSYHSLHIGSTSSSGLNVVRSDKIPTRDLLLPNQQIAVGGRSHVSPQQPLLATALARHRLMRLDDCARWLPLWLHNYAANCASANHEQSTETLIPPAQQARPAGGTPWQGACLGGVGQALRRNTAFSRRATLARRSSWLLASSCSRAKIQARASVRAGSPRWPA